MDENDYEILNLIKDFKTVILLNKTDLEAVVKEEDIKAVIDARVIPISAKEQTGIDDLSNHIVELFTNKEIDYNDEVYISNERDKVALDNAIESLRLVIRSINDGMPEDFYTIDLMNAYTELGKVIGEALEDDLVNEIFGKFCMGK
jgi:tRNA modification GTPase